MAKVKNREIIEPFLDIFDGFNEFDFESFVKGEHLAYIYDSKEPSPLITDEKKFRELYEYKVTNDFIQRRTGNKTSLPNQYKLKALEEKSNSKAEKQFGYLLDIIKKDFTHSRLLVDQVYPRSSLVLGELEIETCYSYFFSKAGEKTKDWGNMSRWILLQESLIFPYQKDKNKNSLKLRIPSAIVNTFYGKDIGKLEFYLGTDGFSTDDLYIFPVRKDKKIRFIDMRMLDPKVIIEPEAIDRSLLTIWKNPVPVVEEGDGWYLNLPNEFFEITEYDSIDLPDIPNAPEKPGFVISYDLYGNLRFQRVLFTTQENNKLQYPFEFALFHDNPDRVKLKKISTGGRFITEKITVNELRGTQLLKSLIEAEERERQNPL